MRKTQIALQIAIGLAVAALSVSGPAMAQNIGKADAVVLSVWGEIERQRSPLSAGDQVFLNQLIQTESKASTSIVFNDQTRLAIGSKSIVLLDKFVYRPGSRSNRLVLNATRGALRFVTGRAKSSSYRINTPTATIGVRGTDFDVYVDRYKSTLLLLRDGIVRICRRGVTDIWSPSADCRTLDAAHTFVLITTSFIAGPFIWDNRSPMDIMFDNRPQPGSSGEDEDNSGVVGPEVQEDEEEDEGGGNT